MTRLTAVQHRVIQDMIEHGGFTLKQIFFSAGCSIHAVASIRDNTSVFGASEAPTQRAGPPSSITPEMRHALCEFLSKRSDRYLEEMRAYMHATSGVLVSVSTISRTLKTMRWSKKKNRRRAKEQNADLRDFYM